MPLIEAQGITLVGVSVANLDDERADPARRCRSTPTTRARSTPRSTRCASASATGAITRAVLLGRDQGLTMPLLPD